jgi:hypothetical protein
MQAVQSALILMVLELCWGTWHIFTIKATDVTIAGLGNLWPHPVVEMEFLLKWKLLQLSGENYIGNG